MKDRALVFLIVLLSTPSCRRGSMRNRSDVVPSAEKRVFMDPGRPVDERVSDLIGRMALAEKVSQMTHASPAVERFGVPAYDWWSECLHGVARAGRATVFPQAIGMAATFDEDLIFRVAIGGCSPGRRGVDLGAPQPVQAVFTLRQTTQHERSSS